GPPRKAQTWAGTDRQCRGRLLAVVRDHDGPVPPHRLDQAWSDDSQRTRCLESLLTDGLLVRVPEGYALPGESRAVGRSMTPIRRTITRESPASAPKEPAQATRGRGDAVQDLAYLGGGGAVVEGPLGLGAYGVEQAGQ